MPFVLGRGAALAAFCAAGKTVGDVFERAMERLANAGRAREVETNRTANKQLESSGGSCFSLPSPGLSSNGTENRPKASQNLSHELLILAINRGSGHRPPVEVRAFSRCSPAFKGRRKTWLVITAAIRTPPER